MNNILNYKYNFVNWLFICDMVLNYYYIFYNIEISFLFNFYLLTIEAIIYNWRSMGTKFFQNKFSLINNNSI